MNSKSQLLAFPSGEPIKNIEVFPPRSIPVRTFRDWVVFVRITNPSRKEFGATLSIIGLEFGGIGHTDEIRQVFDHKDGLMVVNSNGEIFFLDGDAAIGLHLPKLEPIQKGGQP